MEPSRWPAQDEASLVAELETWLAGVTDLASLSADELRAALVSRLEPGRPGELDDLAPATWTSPLGTRLVVDYGQDPPAVACRLQELFGLDRHPCILAGRVPLTLQLLSPAGRPIQVTGDLAGFWRGSYAEVRKALRGRYPKHPWPEDPASATPWRPGLKRGA
jgi:ATP-dependent helicase HrpB